MKKFLTIVLLACAVGISAQEWTTLLAYNHVSQIAVAPEDVYAVSDGNLFCVNKIYETITPLTTQTGLHYNNIEQIGYDPVSQSLLIIYEMGRIDIITRSGVQAVTDYFNKDITASKHVNNITFHNGNAYLSTAFGIVRFNMLNHTFIESCYIGDEASEMNIEDVTFADDSIYARTTTDIYAASMKDDIMDYRNWHISSRTVDWDINKGIYETDSHNETWVAGGGEGLVRIDNLGQKVCYKPDGPIVNNCYRIRVSGKKLVVVPGKYADYINFGHVPGQVMIMDLESKKWTNFSSSYMSDHLGATSEDYCNIAIDPNDDSHFFISSFGYGLIEFRNNEFYKHHLPTNSGIEGVWQGAGLPYIWVDGLRYDKDGNLWMTNIADNRIKVLKRDSSWVVINNGACSGLNRSQDLIISNQDPNIKIVSGIKDGIGVWDDNGTIEDQTDDKAAFIPMTFRTGSGQYVIPGYITAIFQSYDGILWIGTDIGLYRINNPKGILDDTYACDPVRMDIKSEADDVFASEPILCFEEDNYHRVWVGTMHNGLYCISEDRKEIAYHITQDNSPLLSENIQSLAYDSSSLSLYIGTGAGLMKYIPKDTTDDTSTNHIDGREEMSYGSMKGWKAHFSFANISSIEESENTIYCETGGLVLAINKKDEEMQSLSKLTGLKGSNVSLISYNKETGKTLLLYRDGLIDILSADGTTTNMPDLFLKTQLSPTEFYHAYSEKEFIYISSGLGIIKVNMKRNEISESYQLRDNGHDVPIYSVGIYKDSIYAASLNVIYRASLTDNLIDYSNWQTMPFPQANMSIQAMHVSANGIYVLCDSTLYNHTDKQWKKLLSQERWEKIYSHSKSLCGLTKNGLYEISGNECKKLDINYRPNDMLRSGNDYWIAEPEQCIVRWNPQTGTQQFDANSPFVNLIYRIRINKDKMIIVPGGYFSDYYERPGNVMVKENDQWTNYTYHLFKQHLGGVPTDFCDAAIDPNDPSHFYIASFGYGLFEFRNNQWYKFYNNNNTFNGLESILGGSEIGFTWVDGLSLDSEGNLWMLNNSQNGVKVLLKNGKWVRYNNIATRDLNRSKDLLIWNQNPNIKITTCNRIGTGVGIFDDRGTIENTGDDKAVFYRTFVDQNGKSVAPDYIYSICQMADGSIWVGTEKGLIILPDIRKQLNGSNECKRIIIPRNDGTELGDYLLGDEIIYAIAEDAAGRKWIGTATSGLYLVSQDGLMTFEHFTMNNSPLASNGIYSLAVHPKTGEVYIGTSIGLMSYQSDANEAQENFDSIYAYPNPVTANYSGYISISGLMDNTVVNIIDAGGNLVCKTRSNGGLAVWDGKLADGRRATPGIYTALCNSATGHSVCKILVLNATR